MLMYAQAMSSAKKGKSKFTLCSHISKFDIDFFHRAKPATEMKRSGIEVHYGVTGCTNKLFQLQASSSLPPNHPPLRADQ